MLKIRPVVAIGIGPQAQRTVQRYVRLVRERQGEVPALLPMIIEYSSAGSSSRYDRDNVQHIALESPSFSEDSEWPDWLPLDLRRLSPTERERTRAWMRAALLQCADDLQEYLLERIPRLLSFATVEALGEKGLGLAGDSEVDVYVIADLGDHLGSGVLIDVAHLAASVCRQLGLRPYVSGLLYLPSSTSPAPIEEAIAYAALKELEYCARGHASDGGSALYHSLGRETALFADGCCLLDNVNEAGYTLQDEEQLLGAACEQLYAMTFQDMANAVRERRHARYRRATLRGKARAYESFGVAIRYVPRRLLVDWAAARLGTDIVGRILNDPVDVDPEQQVRAFVDRTGLRIEVLEDKLRQTAVAGHIEGTLDSLRRAGIGQIEGSSRDALQTIRDRHVPALKQQVQELGAQMQREVRGAVAEKVQVTLEDTPAGGISLLHAFLGLLADHVRALQDEIQEQARSQQHELSRSLGTVSETYYALRNVAMGMPPWPVAVLSLIAVLVFPFFYQLALINRALRPLHTGWTFVALGILVGGALGVLGLVIGRLIRQRRVLSERHVHMVRERFTLESRPIVNREMGAVCEALQNAIACTESDLDDLVEQLHVVKAQLGQQERVQARRLQELVSPGPFCSVIDRDAADHFYARSVPDVERSILALTQHTGPVSKWIAQRVESGESFATWLCAQLSDFGTQHLEPSAQRFTVVEALSRDGAELGQVLERLFDRAHPLWNYDPRFLRRAKTQRLTFVGADTGSSTWPALAGPLSEICPEAIARHTGDPSALTVMNVHLGVPLFALRRIGQYRTHYAEALWRGKLPLHTTNALALSVDLVPIRRLKIHPTTLFAVGLALEVIQPDPDGRYVAPRAAGKTIRLSAHKERSAALMGMDATACREVQRQLGAMVVQEGAEPVRARLDAYATDAPGLADWEVKGIIEFCGTGERENGTPVRMVAAQPRAGDATPMRVETAQPRAGDATRPLVRGS